MFSIARFKISDSLRHRWIYVVASVIRRAQRTQKIVLEISLRFTNVTGMYSERSRIHDGSAPTVDHNISKRFHCIIQQRPIEQAYGGCVFRARNIVYGRCRATRKCLYPFSGNNNRG